MQSFGNLLVSPNPSNFIIHIEGLAEQYEIEIYNLLGECVLTFKLNDSKIDLDIRNLIAGIYLIKNGQINSSKLIVLNH
ncbi:MAG: T9SS type A sorting domain-containing protein [Bacteroidetes bacterium]|nr:T9SS type A sorting domain-containing protein [Bacteroidota bacterium]